MHPVQVVCPDISISQLVSSTVSVWTSGASRQPWIKAKTEIFVNLTTGRAMHTLLYIGDRAFTVAAPRAWNSLPDSLHKLSFFVNFKKHLKFYLFTNSLAQHDIWSEALSRRIVLLTALNKLSTSLSYLLTCLLGNQETAYISVIPSMMSVVNTSGVDCLGRPSVKVPLAGLLRKIVTYSLLEDCSTYSDCWKSAVLDKGQQLQVSHHGSILQSASNRRSTLLPSMQHTCSIPFSGLVHWRRTHFQTAWETVPLARTRLDNIWRCFVFHDADAYSALEAFKTIMNYTNWHWHNSSRPNSHFVFEHIYSVNKHQTQRQYKIKVIRTLKTLQQTNRNKRHKKREIKARLQHQR